MPKRKAGLPESPITSAETNTDVSVEESGPVSVEDDLVQEAEKLKHVPAPVLPSKAEVEAHNVSHLPFTSWCSECVRGPGFSLGHRKVDTKTKERYRRSPWTEGSSGNWKTEHTTHFQCPQWETARARASGVTRCRQRV